MMKKVLAVLVVFATLCFGGAVFAAHEIADVDRPVVPGGIEVYGIAKLSVDMIDTGGQAPADTSLTRVSSNSSRLGFKGSEDLGDGLSAVFQVELGINWDGTTSTVCTEAAWVDSNSNGIVDAGEVKCTKTTSVNTISLRNTYAGLSSKSFGTVLLGTHDTPYKVSTGTLDVFADSMGDYNAIMGNVNGTTNFDLRPKDVIAYLSPSWGGVQISAASVQTGTESSNGANSDPSAYSFSANYKSGSLYAALAHEIHKNGITSWDAGTTITGTKAGLGYSFGNTKVGAVYEMINDDKSNSQFSRNALYLALSQKLGKETIKFAYGVADDGDDPATESGATLMVAGIDHALSKRTTLYALYAATKNDKDATYGLGQGGAGGAFTPGVDEDPSVISFGINHSF